MISAHKIPSIEQWTHHLRVCLNESEPALLDIFETYAAEAKFGRSFINADLRNLEKSAHILEVGAGSMILSCQLVIEGYKVTALEPTGEGFSHFSKLRSFVLAQATKLACAPELLLIPAEELVEKNLYDFAFSINVMEHVDNVESVIYSVFESLKPSGTYHFTCPNYSFPYEPHFNIPTFFNKKLTEYILRKNIHNNQKMPDPIGTWHSLNWISVTELRKIAKRHKKLSIQFNWKILEEALIRIQTDDEFASRRSVFIRLFVKLIVFTKLHKLSQYLPTLAQPIIDCKILKLNGKIT